MIFETYGQKANKCIVLMHPMFTSAAFFEKEIKYLSKCYYVVVPTYSGHYEGSIFTSWQDEIKALHNFLENDGVSKVYCMIGFSLGGNLCYKYFCEYTNDVENIIVDSAPMFCFPKFIKRHFYKKYERCLLKIKSGKVDAATELNKCFNSMGQYQQYVAPKVDIRSLSGLIDACFDVKLKSLEDKDQKKITFVYGTKDIAKMCLSRIKKYKHSKFVIIKGGHHCSYFKSDFKKYIGELLENKSV